MVCRRKQLFPQAHFQKVTAPLAQIVCVGPLSTTSEVQLPENAKVLPKYFHKYAAA